MTSFESLLHDDLQDRILDFDSAVAMQAAALAARRQRAGKPVDMRDTQIAGIALAHRAGIVTCNARHFSNVLWQ